MTTELSDRDEGKDVVSSSGERVGVVAAVDDGTLHVAPDPDPDPDLTDEVKSKFGLRDSGADTYPVSREDVATVTADEVRLGHGS
jgi:hypothetical protein